MAESLFQEGRKLLRDKKYDAACPKFVESARLDPSSGVELALGLCYEGLGKTASAWAAYVMAASLARRDNRADREKAANEHATALAPKLSRVTIEVAPETAKLAGLEVREDGVILGSEAWKDAPLDPGEHSVTVTAPGKKPYKTSFLIEARATMTTMDVPPLEDEALPAPPPKTQEEPGIAAPAAPEHERNHNEDAGGTSHEEESALKPVGFVVGSAGVLSLGVGAVLGLIAINKANSVNKVCSPPTCSNAEAVAANGTAGTLADWSTGTFIAGGVGLAAGALLVLFAPAPAAAHKAAARLHAVVGPRAMGLECDW
jgi:hypothetical protein